MAVQENVIIKFDAQTQAALTNLAKVAGGFDKIGDSAKKAGDTSNSGLDKVTAGLLKVNLAIGTAEKAAQALGKAFEFAQFSAEMDKLKTLVGEGLVSSVQRATNGVVSQMDIMREAAKNTASAFKLTDQQVTDVWAASKNLADKGIGSVTENAEKMFKALRKGTTDELKEFGITIKDGLDKAEKMDAALRGINRAAGDTSGMSAQVDSLRRASVAFQEVADVIKATVGAALIQVIEGLQFLGNELDQLFNRATGYKAGNASRRGGLAAANKIADEARAKFGGGGMWNQSYILDIAEGRRQARTPEQAQFIRERYNELSSANERAAGIVPPTPGLTADQRAYQDSLAADKKDTRWDSYKKGMYGQGARRYSTTDDLVGKPMGFSSPVGNVSFGGGASAYDSTSALASLRGGTSKDSTLADLFPGQGAGGFGSGFASGFADVRAEMLSLQEVGKLAADTTISTVQAAVQAGISGEMSLMKAAKAAIGGRLANEAVSWGFRGAAMLLMGDPKGAGMIALSAAAIVAARAMGGGAAAAATGVPRTSGYMPGGYGAGFGGREAAGPSNVSIYMRGNGAQNVAQFDAAYRNAKAAGYIQSGDGPSRLVG